MEGQSAVLSALPCRAVRWKARGEESASVLTCGARRSCRVPFVAYGAGAGTRPVQRGSRALPEAMPLVGKAAEAELLENGLACMGFLARGVAPGRVG